MSKKHKFLYNIPSDIKLTDYHHKANIVDCVASIIKKFKKYDEVVAVAEMQSGKTEVMKRLIYVVNNYNDKIKNMNIGIDKHNVYVIICASCTNLKQQLKTKLPEITHKIFHLNDIQSIIKNIFEYESLLTTMADSGLIIFDESHCDAEKDKLIDKFRTMLDKYAKENDTTYHKIGFSATPYEQILAGYPKIIMKPGENYYGIRQMFETCRSTAFNKGLLPILFQAKNLSIVSECEQLFSEIIICNFYYIFRLPGNKSAEEAMMLNLEKQFKIQGAKFDSYVYDMTYTTNINELLNSKPVKPTIIYLKDKLRMGEYLNTKFVYMVHDDPNNTHVHTTAQSLVGRCCGYDKKSHQTIIYCDYQKAYNHYKWIINNYDIDHIPANAKYIDKKNGTTKDICIF